MRGLVFVMLLALTGCGSDSAKRRVSARFSERTVHEGGRVESTRGAFDWSAMRGWAERGEAMRLVQLGHRCYRRYAGERWKVSKATDVDGLCDAGVFGNPATEEQLVRSVASDWEKLGPASVRGVQTTHYRGRLSLGAVQGRIELWVDADGVVRRERQQDGFVSVREYFDFGGDVNVQAPQVGAGG